jgi:hypothetical protein
MQGIGRSSPRTLDSIADDQADEGLTKRSAIVRANRIKLNKLFNADAADAKIGSQTADRKWGFT